MKQNPPIKAIFFDIDGTLLSTQQRVLPSTIEAIKHCRSNGLLIGLATGRDATSCQQLITTHWHLDGLIDLIVGTSGADLIDFNHHTHHCSYPLSGDLVEIIIDHFKDLPVNFCIPDQGVLVGPKDDALLRGLAKVDNVDYRVVDYSTYLANLKHSKLVIICKPEDMDQIIERAKTFHDDRFKSQGLKTCSILYEYMDPRVSKTNGIIESLSSYGLTMDDVMVFGDEDNDLDMLTHAYLGITMANGSSKAKQAADYITTSNDDDGIYNALKHFFDFIH